MNSGRKAFVYAQYFTRRLWCFLFCSNMEYWVHSFRSLLIDLDDQDEFHHHWHWHSHSDYVDWLSEVGLTLLPEINRAVSRIFSRELPPLLNTQRLWIKDEAGRGETETWRKKVYKKDPSVGSCGMRCRFTCIKLVACPGRAQWAEALQQVRIEHKPLHPRVTQQPPKQKWETQILWIWVRKVNFFILSLLAARSLLGVVSSPASDAFYTFNR